MKVLSLLQPWATLAVLGVKTIETRAWGTAYRGDLLIHSGRSKAGSIFADGPPFKKHIPDFKALHFGAIIGMVTLEAILPLEDFDLNDIAMNSLTLEEKAFGEYTNRRYGWLFSAAVPFATPIPARGMLHLWEYHGAIEDNLF